MDMDDSINDDDKWLAIHRYVSITSYISAVLLRDYTSELEQKERERCKQIVFDLGKMFTKASRYEFVQAGNGVEAIVVALFVLISEDNRHLISEDNPLYLLLKLILMDWSDDSRIINQISSNIWECGKQYTVGKEPYFEKGIEWIYILIQKDPECDAKLYVNTLYYLEEYVGSFVASHRNDFRTEVVLAQKTQAVLEYMVGQGSQIAFLSEKKFDTSLEKMLYLASGNITKKWTQCYRNWDQVLGQLIILYDERLTPYL